MLACGCRQQGDIVRGSLLYSMISVEFSILSLFPIHPVFTMLCRKFIHILPLLILAGTAYFAFVSFSAANKSTLPVSGFSVDRALSQLKAISSQPHYYGSAGHNDVQTYIVEQLQQLGLDVDIQQQPAFSKTFRSAATAHNIIARIKGHGKGKALVLMSHYDSFPHSSPGASDAGSGVVVILEGIRAFLEKEQTPRNDIIILFTDAEEIGLLGAKAFVNHHPWSQDTGLVLNFEARGSGGPSYMLIETGNGNQQLIQSFRQAGIHSPVASSLLYSIYKLLPNDTDLTVFREDGGIHGYNFAFIDDHFDYHTAQDTLARLDRGSLQHQAAYLMPLLNYFAEYDLSTLDSAEDSVYFALPAVGLVVYPYSMVRPVLTVVALLFAALLLYGIKKQQIALRPALTGFLPFLSSLLLAGLLSYLGYQLLFQLSPHFRDIRQGFPYNGHGYIATASTLSLVVFFAVYSRYLRKITTLNLLISPIIIWLLLNAMAAIYLKGAGYFILAPATALLSMALLIFSPDSMKRNRVLISLINIPSLLVFLPMIRMFPVGLGIHAAIISSLLLILLAGLLLPLFSATKKPLTVAFLFALATALLLGFATTGSTPDAEHRSQNSIVYLLDADNNQAYWASYDHKPDSYTRQFLGNKPESGRLFPDTAINRYSTGVRLYRQTETISVALPIIEARQTRSGPRERTVSISIQSQTDADILEVVSESPIHLRRLQINGLDAGKTENEEFVLTPVKNSTLIRFYTHGDNIPLNIQFTLPVDETLDLTLYETAYGLPQDVLSGISARDTSMMPAPLLINDARITRSRISGLDVN